MAFFRHIDDEFDFGKYKGLSLSDVMDINPEYITWCMLNISNSQYCTFIITDKAVQELVTIYRDFILTAEFEEKRKMNIQWEHDNNIGENINICDNAIDEQDSYERYNGSYAQDEMGYSDDDIDTIFDGDPSAYWNID